MTPIRLLPLILLLCGCTGPMTYRQAKLPDGAELRVYHATSLASPSVTIVAMRPAGTTNWTVSQTFSGPGLVPGASTGGGIAAAGALLRPDRTHVRAAGGNSDAAASGGDGGEGGAGGQGGAGGNGGESTSTSTANGGNATATGGNASATGGNVTGKTPKPPKPPSHPRVH